MALLLVLRTPNNTVVDHLVIFPCITLYYGYTGSALVELGVLVLCQHSISVCMCVSRRWVPVFSDQSQKLSVMSIGFLLQSSDDAVVWRGPKKNGGSRHTSVVSSHTVTVVS